MASHNINLTLDPRLSRMLQMQRELQLVYNNGKTLEQFTDEERMQAIRDNVLACTAELHEAMDESGWKPWATSNHLNHEAFKAELVDAWHFFMNLMLHSGMTAEDLYDGYIKKNAKNVKRQADGYDGVSTKCPRCHRAADDNAVECYPHDVGDGAWWCDEAKSDVDENGRQLP